MLNLVLNENMKIYRRIRSWILIGLLIALTATAAILTSKMMNPTSQPDWKQQTAKQISQDHEMLQDPNLNSKQREIMENRIKVNEYRLAHDIPTEQNTVWAGVMDSAGLVQIVTVFTVIIAADIVAGEFATGTIKLLLIRPANRAKILLSKYLSVLLFSLFLLAVLFLSSYVTNGILHGFGGTDLPYLYATGDGVVHEDSMLVHALGTYGLKCIELIMIVTMTFMISTVFRSSSLAIGISLMAMFVGSLVLLFIMKYSWAKYYLFANTDLSQYLEGNPLLQGMTLPFSIAVLLVYFFVFNLLSWTIFMKRDVAA